MDRTKYRGEAQKIVFRRKCAAEAAAEQAREHYLSSHPEFRQAEREMANLAAAG